METSIMEKKMKTTIGPDHFRASGPTTSDAEVFEFSLHGTCLRRVHFVHP